MQNDVQLLFMRKNKLISFLLLFTLCFSIFHEYAVVLDEHSHGSCDVTKLSYEFIETPNTIQNDTCSNYCIYHASFIMPLAVSFHMENKLSDIPRNIQSIYSKKVYKNFLKPPIS